mmetsp:Transcript_49332/g.159462  ORF Transcript_49332/g.159462 Transcript_49332/m.159462 type:complete len:218 (-) Transcript_49332:17-670(-)
MCCACTTGAASCRSCPRSRSATASGRCSRTSTRATPRRSPRTTAPTARCACACAPRPPARATIAARRGTWAAARGGGGRRSRRWGATPSRPRRSPRRLAAWSWGRARRSTRRGCGGRSGRTRPPPGSSTSSRSGRAPSSRRCRRSCGARLTTRSSRSAAAGVASPRRCAARSPTFGTICCMTPRTLTGSAGSGRRRSRGQRRLGREGVCACVAASHG